MQECLPDGFAAVNLIIFLNSGELDHERRRDRAVWRPPSSQQRIEQAMELQKAKDAGDQSEVEFQVELV